MDNQLLLLEDVNNLGRKGDVVRAKPGYARNFLLPKKKATIASKQALKLRAKLQEERFQQAVVDKAQSEELAKIIDGKVFHVEVKLDPEGHMYGSVSVHDLLKLIEQEGIKLEKSDISLPHPLKKVGTHRVDLKLKEGVQAHFTVKIRKEGTPEEEIEIPIVTPEA